MAGRRQTLDLMELAGREVDAVEEDERQRIRMLRDGSLEIARPDRGLACAWADDDEVALGVQPTLGEMAGQRVPIGREERGVGEDPAPTPNRAEERGE